MGKNILIAFFVFLLVVSIGLFTVKKPDIQKKSFSLPQKSTEQKVTSKEIEIIANEYSFTPSFLDLEKGEKVSITFKNLGSSPHSLFIDGYNISTKNILPGNSANLSFIADKTGTFDFYCSVGNHKDLGMTGILEVK